jgi:hypothetical protein
MSKLVYAMALLAVVVFAAAVLADDANMGQQAQTQFVAGSIHGIHRDSSGNIDWFALQTHDTSAWPGWRIVRVDVSKSTQYWSDKDMTSWADLKIGERVVAHLDCIPNSDRTQASSVRIVSFAAPALYCTAYQPPQYPYGPTFPEYRPYGPMYPGYDPYRPGEGLYPYYHPENGGRMY